MTPNAKPSRDADNPTADEIRDLQQRKLAMLWRQVMDTNPFWSRRFAGVEFDLDTDPISKLPLTCRQDLQDDQQRNPPFGTNLTEPLGRYVRFHQTSGTSGRAVRFLDTEESWEWWKSCWRTIFSAAGVTSSDRIVFPFSFGPFIGFWSAFDAAVSMGCLALPAGGMSSVARLHYVLQNDVTIICCTPTYAMHLVEVARSEGINIQSSSVRGLIVAGEPGGSIPATRQRIESAFSARVFDHIGMTEVGPWGFECADSPQSVHVNESEFIAEVIDPESGQIQSENRPGELVLTNLGRTACPVFRYRTGDRVQLSRGTCACGRNDVRLVGGVLGRVDDMITVRGNNVFPSAIEDIVRSFEDVAEFRIAVQTTGAMDRLLIQVEPHTSAKADLATLAAAVRQAIKDALHFNAAVELVQPGALPRFEMKSHRIVRE